MLHEILSLLSESHLLDFFIWKDLEEFEKDGPGYHRNEIAYSKVDQVAQLVLSLGFDTNHKEDQEILDELVNTEGCGLGIKLKAEKAANQTVDSCVLDTPRECHKDGQHPVEIIDGSVED